ncbi:MAG: PQQ-like beta-propeller repeat protein, partial [Chloroflexi bacterium]|nr:PQQ-like beta-propeller repeat protein [Chloroflexota bacterium]
MTRATAYLATLLVTVVMACGAPLGEGPPSPTFSPIPDVLPGPRPATLPAESSQWPMFRQNLQHTGAVGDSGLGQDPTLRWKLDTGGVVESSPAVVDGVLYQGTFNLSLLALDASTGRPLWRFPVGGLLRASPSVADGVVYFGADDNRFYALDAATGQIRWSFPLVPGGEQSSPAV